MYINHTHKFIFVHVPKTGGMTTRYFFRNNKIKNQSYLEDENLDNKDVDKVINRYIENEVQFMFTLHLPITFMKKYYSDEFNSYYKFGVVRNPYDRFISSFYYKQPVNVFELDIESTKKFIKQKYIPRIEAKKNTMQVVLPQHKFLCDENGKIIVNKVYRYAKDLKPVLENMILDLNLPIVNPIMESKNISSKSRFDKNLLLDDELKNWIYDFYKKDFEIFEYSKNYPA